MKEILWTPASISVGERADRMLALVFGDPIEITSIPLGRTDAHRIGSALVEAAAVTLEEIIALEPAIDDEVLQ